MKTRVTELFGIEEPVIQVIPLWGTGLAGEQKEGDSHGI